MTMFGPIVMCVRKDELVARALDGDKRAVLILAHMSPADLLPRELRRQRDERLREIAAQLIAEQIGKSARHVAAMMSLAGKRLARPHGDIPRTKLFNTLSFDEREWLTKQIRQVLAWANGAEEFWPSFSSMRRILNELGGSQNPTRDEPVNSRSVGADDDLTDNEVTNERAAQDF
jgi:hypothetical protein